MPSTYYVARWNLDDLFDEENSPRRTEKLQRTLGNDIVGWTPARRDKKLSQLSSVIAQMNGGAGPDLLGVCEVENRFVLDLLIDSITARLPVRNYELVHADTSDARGIDVAFVYDPGILAVPAGEVFFFVVMRRNATRELVQVNIQTHKNRTFTVFGNHWPSRSGGRYESAGYRDIAGETLSYYHQRALEVHGATTAVLAMGDFNDEPFDTSLVIHALSTRQRQTCRRCRQPAALEPHLVGDRRPNRRQLLLQQRTESARPVPRQQEHGTPRLTDPRQAGHARNSPFPRHLHRQVQTTQTVLEITEAD